MQGGLFVYRSGIRLFKFQGSSSTESDAFRCAVTQLAFDGYFFFTGKDNITEWAGDDAYLTAGALLRINLDRSG